VTDYIRSVASAGGRARADKLSSKERLEISKKASRARWRGTTKQERAEAARRAALARWAKKKP